MGSGCQHGLWGGSSADFSGSKQTPMRNVSNCKALFPLTPLQSAVTSCGMMQRLWIHQIRSAFLKLFVVFTLLVFVSGLGHAGSHTPDHARADIVHEYSLTSDHETNHCGFLAASAGCETHARSVGEHQTSDECCDGVCMSSMPPQPRATAVCVEASETFARAAEFEPSAGATTDLRPPRVPT